MHKPNSHACGCAKSSDRSKVQMLRLAQGAIAGTFAGVLVVLWGLQVLAMLPHWQAHCLVMVITGAVATSAMAAVAIISLNSLEAALPAAGWANSLLLWLLYRLLAVTQLISLLIAVAAGAAAVLGVRLPLL
ncbi:MAG: hypothetical protein HKL96_11795 [Phycisphaerales bacterium]|nr:hypothetical protein [Phycisphaerales bacterium]